jgi:hypothetical protein
MYRCDKNKILLTAIIKQRMEVDRVSNSSEKPKEDVVSLSPSVASNHVNVSIIPEKPSIVASSPQNQAKGKLITFDSTDPDFDDDSDPDADLDL